MGPEVKFDFGAFGWGYVGWSHIDARNIAALADSLEVIHSYGGSQFKQNYFGRTYNGHTGTYQGPQNETGKVDTVAAQYSFSFAQWARYPEDFWGDGVDLVLTAFGMLSIVDSPPPPTATDPNLKNPLSPTLSGNPALATQWNMTTKKLKFGGDAYYTPYSWLGLGVRFDMVQPDLDAAYSRPNNGLDAGGSELNFSVLTPRLVFRTAFVTHETISIMYQRYFLGSRVYPPFPYEWVVKSDENVVAASATLWW